MTIIKILSLLFVALVAGGWMMGSLLVVPAQKHLTAQEYTAVEQANTSFGKRYFPIVVVASIIVLGILTYLSRHDKTQMVLIGASLVLMVAALGFTRAKVVPLNTRIEQWSVQTPPADWKDSRDAWHRNHRIRTGIAFVAFLLLATAIVQGSSASTQTSSLTSNTPKVRAS